MDLKRLNVFIVASVMILAAAFVAINYKLNVYGLFGDVRGRSYNLPGGNMERLGKYLFSLNYFRPTSTAFSSARRYRTIGILPFCRVAGFIMPPSTAAIFRSRGAYRRKRATAKTA